jgi:hypothetical protein
MWISGKSQGTLLPILCFFDQIQDGVHFVLRGGEYSFDLRFVVVLFEEILNRQLLEPAIYYLVTWKLFVNQSTVLKREVVA